MSSITVTGQQEAGYKVWLKDEDSPFDFVDFYHLWEIENGLFCDCAHLNIQKQKSN